SVPAQAAKALGAAGDKRAVPHLIAKMNDREVRGFAREEAVRALGKIGDSRALKPLLEALKDRTLQREAIDALGDLGDVKAVGTLTKLYKPNTSPGPEVGLALALGKIGGPEACTFMRNALDKHDEEDFIKPLIKAGDRKFVAILIAKCRNKDNPQRGTWVRRLAFTEGPEAVGYLVELLSDELEGIRSSAAYILGHMPTEAVVPALIPAMKSSNAQTRAAATEALGSHKDIRVIEPLITALGDSDEDVWLNASNALGSVTGRRSNVVYGLRQAARLKWWRAWWAKSKQEFAKECQEYKKKQKGSER
ncbi:hypothetical protein LCGC14_1501810, partial [marine sediment metagenome]